MPDKRPNDEIEVASGLAAPCEIPGPHAPRIYADLAARESKRITDAMLRTPIVYPTPADA